MLMEIYQAAVVREAPGNRGKRDKHCELAAAVRAELLELRKVSAEQRFLIDEGFLRVETQLAATA
jgi:hypothetical protein